MRNILYILAISTCLGLIACGGGGPPQPAFRLADNKIVCDAKSGDAYIVSPAEDDKSYVKRISAGDGICAMYSKPVPAAAPASAASAS